MFRGSKLKARRLYKRKSLHALSRDLFRFEHVQVSYEAIRRYELGKRRPAFDLVISFATVLGCHPVTLCEPKRRGPLSRDQVEHDRILKDRAQLRRKHPRGQRVSELENIGPRLK